MKIAIGSLRVSFAATTSVALWLSLSLVVVDPAGAADAPQRPDPVSTGEPNGARPRANLRTKSPALVRKSPAATDADTTQPTAGTQPVAAPLPGAYDAFTPGGAPPGQAAASPTPSSQQMPQIPPGLFQSMAPPSSSSRKDSNGKDLDFSPGSASNNGGQSCNSSGEAMKECNCTSGSESDGFKSLGPAIQAAKDYREKNSQAVSSTKIAVNDYRSKVGCMYIIDTSDNSCYATTSAWGTGSNQGEKPVPGCKSGSLMTPAGFHVTAVHNGGRYNASNCLGMTDLQGQGSSARGILIHQGSCNGGASTWGCSGVGNFEEVKEKLGIGTLVYNYFGDGNVGDCSGATDASAFAGAPVPSRTDVEEDPENFKAVPAQKPGKANNVR